MGSAAVEVAAAVVARAAGSVRVEQTRLSSAAQTSPPPSASCASSSPL